MLSGQFLELEQLIGNGAVLRSKTVECVEWNATSGQPTGVTGKATILGVDIDGVMIPLMIQPSFNVASNKGVGFTFDKQIWVKADRAPSSSSIATASWGTEAPNGMLKLCRIRTSLNGYVYIQNISSTTMYSSNPQFIRYSDEAALQDSNTTKPVLLAAYNVLNYMWQQNSQILRACTVVDNQIEPTTTVLSIGMYYQAASGGDSYDAWTIGSKTHCLFSTVTSEIALPGYLSYNSSAARNILSMCDTIKDANNVNVSLGRYVLIHPYGGSNFIGKLEACHASRVSEWGYTTSTSDGYFIRLVDNTGAAINVPKRAHIAVL